MASRTIIPTDDTGSVFDLVDSLSSLSKRAIIRPNNPPAGIAGYLFDIPEDDQIDCRAEITPHFVEANVAIQDHIGLSPESYTVRGLVAELALVTPQPEHVAKIADALPENPFFLPDLTEYQTQTYDDTVDVDAITAEDSQDLWQLFNNLSPQPPSQTKQARAWAYFYQLYKGRQLFTVETPWGVLTNMAIEFLSANQGDETKFSSTFTITFVKIRIVGETTVSVGQLAGRAASQMATVTNNGNAGKTDVSDTSRASLLSRWINPSP